MSDELKNKLIIDALIAGCARLQKCERLLNSENESLHNLHLSAERLVEDYLPKCSQGKYKKSQVDAHCDYTDLSDAKTCRINKNGEGMITKVTSSSGELKHGALRVVVANFVNNDVGYIYLPKEIWSTVVNHEIVDGKYIVNGQLSSKQSPIKLKYINGVYWIQGNKKKINCSSLMCKTFDDLATKM